MISIFRRIPRECARCEQLASLVADGAASPAEQAELRSHLDNCAACRVFLSSLEQTRYELKSRPIARMPEGLSARLAAAIEKERVAEKSRGRWLSPVNLRYTVPAFGAAVLAVGLFAAHLYKPAAPINVAYNSQPTVSAPVPIKINATSRPGSIPEHHSVNIAKLPPTQKQLDVRNLLQVLNEMPAPAPQHSESKHATPSVAASEKLPIPKTISVTKTHNPAIDNDNIALLPPKVVAPSTGSAPDISPFVKTPPPATQPAPVEVAVVPSEAPAPIAAVDSGSHINRLLGDLAKHYGQTASYTLSVANMERPVYSGALSIVTAETH